MIHDLDDSGSCRGSRRAASTIVRGNARIVGERRVDVDGRQLEARRAVVIATGSEAAIPPIPGLAEAHAWTNREATTSKEVPERLIVLGGGVVGVELGQAWRTLGSKVTIVEAFPRLLGREEEFAATLVHESLSSAASRFASARRPSRSRGTAASRSSSSRARSSPATSCSSASAGARRRSDLGLEPSALEPGEPSRSTRRCACPATTGSTRSATPTAARSSRTWASTTARIAADVILGRDARLDDTRRRPALAARRLHRPAGRRRRAHARLRAGRGHRRARGRHGDLRHRGRLVLRPRRAGHLAPRRRRASAACSSARRSCGADVSEFVHAATIAVVGEVPLDRLWHATPSLPDAQRDLDPPARGRTGCEHRTRPSERGADGPRAVAALGALPQRARLGHGARGLQRRAATRGASSRTTTPARAPTAGARTASAGICDDRQTLCFALAFWNGRDPILKERIFGLTGTEGNHGEDAKEYWWYLDSTPTHSWMRWRYMYPQAEFPYERLVAENGARGRDDRSSSSSTPASSTTAATGRSPPTTRRPRPTTSSSASRVRNAGPERGDDRRAADALVPQHVVVGRRRRRSRRSGSRTARSSPSTSDLGTRRLAGVGQPEALFCENETNAERIFGARRDDAVPEGRHRRPRRPRRRHREPGRRPARRPRSATGSRSPPARRRPSSCASASSAGLGRRLRRA